MEISIYLKQYKELGNYFAPDYEQENEVLLKFKKDSPTLSEKQVAEFKNILQSNDRPLEDKYAIADLLYLFTPFSRELMDPMTDCAIDNKDPSFNRIFIRPCIMSFGIDEVNNLIDQKAKEDSTKLEGINRLRYWLHPTENWM